MPTRTRVRAKAPVAPKPEEDNFDPTAVASAEDNPVIEGEVLQPGDDGFYDSQNQPQDADEDQSLEQVDAETVGDEGDENGEGDDGDTDPSSGNQLGNTKAGMTQGQQAAQAELKDYFRRLGNLASEAAEIAADIKELKKEIKGKGYDMTAFNTIFKLIEMEEPKQKAILEQKGINQTYAVAVGVNPDLV
jgi:uncharacterized protein (UPF0335 family)